jgi:MATE family multidrug resistance protein
VRAVVATSLRAGWATGLIVSLLYLPIIPALLPLIAKDTLVVQQASEFVLWAAITPLLSSSAYLLDGLFIGALASKAMRNAMIQSLALFLLSWWVLQPLANHGLWAAMTLFYLARALTLWRARSALFL